MEPFPYLRTATVAGTVARPAAALVARLETFFEMATLGREDRPAMWNRAHTAAALESRFDTGGGVLTTIAVEPMDDATSRLSVTVLQASPTPLESQAEYDAAIMRDTAKVVAMCGAMSGDLAVVTDPVIAAPWD